MQKETLILRRIAELLRDQQSAIAHGAATADFDRDACGRHRARDRDLTSEILGWACLRRDFQTSADFLRSALIAEVRRASGDVDCIIEQNDLAGILDEVVQALQDGAVKLQQTAATTTAAAAAAAAPRSCAAQFAAEQHTVATSGAAGGGTHPATPDRPRTFCLAAGVTERPAKRARGKQGTPHPRYSAVQAAIDSADENDDLDLSDLEAEDLDGLPEGLLSPEAGSVDFGPRTDQERAGGGKSDWASCGKNERD